MGRISEIEKVSLEKENEFEPFGVLGIDFH